jgi:hypothetical protein
VQVAVAVVAALGRLAAVTLAAVAGRLIALAAIGALAAALAFIYS